MCSRKFCNSFLCWWNLENFPFAFQPVCGNSKDILRNCRQRKHLYGFRRAESLDKTTVNFRLRLWYWELSEVSLFVQYSVIYLSCSCYIPNIIKCLLYFYYLLYCSCLAMHNPSQITNIISSLRSFLSTLYDTDRIVVAALFGQVVVFSIPSAIRLCDAVI